MHSSPDVLALLAIGEDAGSEEDHVHISECPACQAQLRTLTAAADAVRRTSDEDVLVSPRPEVWQRIATELHLEHTPTTPATVPGPAAPPVLDGKSRTVPSAPAPAPRPGAATPLRQERRAGSTRNLRAAAVALAAALALAVGVGLGANLDRILPGRQPEVSVRLNALPPFPGSSGRATVEQDASGTRMLAVQIASPEPPTGPREVWLTTSTAQPMVLLGTLTNGSGRFPIPADLDLRQFQLVDISQEPVGDNDTHHSGRSMLRGRLPT